MAERPLKGMPKKIICEPAKHGVSASFLSAWLDCRRKAWLSMHGVRRRGFKGSMIFGDWMHDALHELSVHARKGRTVGPKSAMLTGVAVVKTYRRELGRASARVLEELEYLESIFIPTLVGYVHYYASDYKKPDCLPTESEEEFVVRWTHGGGSRILVGKKDGVQRRKGKPTWVWERKTKGTISEDTIVDMLHFDLQTGLYCIAEEAASGRMPAGIIYDVIRRPGLRLGKDGLDGLRDRVEKDIEKRPEHYYKRWPVKLGSDDFEELKDELACMMSDLHDWLMRVRKHGKRVAYRCGVACDKKWKCEHIPICARDEWHGHYQIKEPHVELPNLREALEKLRKGGDG